MEKDTFTPWIMLFSLSLRQLRLANEIGRNVPPMVKLLSIDTVHEYMK